VFFWYVGVSFVFVAWVFASPAIDYRLVALGSVVPMIEMVFDGPWALHTLLAPVAVMCLVMIVFTGRRLLQRRWLGLPVGMFMYLVLDGAWARAELFWWPVFGAAVDSADLPSWKPLPVLIGMELVGIAAIVHSVRRYRLDSPDSRRLLLTEGRLTRAAMGPGSGSC
jgi:hypothetical protein